MSQSTELTAEELVDVARKVSKLFDQLSKAFKTQIKFAFIGGGACSLLRVSKQVSWRGTSDLDLIVEVKEGCNAEMVSNWLLEKGGIQFVEQFGVKIPAVPIRGGKLLVEVEVFDVQNWPGRPQYNIVDNASNPIMQLDFPQASSASAEDGKIPVMPPWWLLREKLLSQFERQGTPKAKTDITDVEVLLKIADPKSLVLSTKEHVEALAYLVGRRADLKDKLRRVIVCPSVLEK